MSLAFMGKTGRWISPQEKTGYWGPLAQQEAAIEARKIQLASLTTQGLGGEFAAVAVNVVASKSNTLSNEITRMSGVKSRVLGLLHGFVSGVYYESIWGNTAESVFERFRGRVDPILQQAARGLPERMATSYARLMEGDLEAISAAMNTCRRVIDAFADIVFPPSERSIEVENQPLQVGAAHHQNRLNAFVAERTASKTRRKRIRQNLANVYGRVCAGIHDDVSVDEAQSLVLSTYLLLGEVATLAGDGG